jgi:hypothetical protein
MKNLISVFALVLLALMTACGGGGAGGGSANRDFSVTVSGY